EQGDIRLIGNSEANTGTLQVYYNGVWGYVCDDYWGNNDATVVCRQLGYSGLTSTQLGIYAPSTTYWLDNVGCSGTENNISECYHLPWGNHNCGTSEHVNVTCIYGFQ
ncbi:scavenger receptor cysteine-rich domain-containing protein, partial [Salmonella sp. s51228]|uniref:scavenger receptor cysteine-rich domain-containing protein n=1 Tax=Salmonella sp. s51228 TaxID=3159652 RepID=UPI00397EFCD5